MPAGDVLLRWLSDTLPNMLVRDARTGERTPHKGAFKLDVDGISVYSDWARREVKLSLASILKPPFNLLVRVPADSVRSIPGLSVVGDPWPDDIPDPDHPRNAAHALIKGVEAGIDKRTRRDRRDALVALLRPENIMWPEQLVE